MIVLSGCSTTRVAVSNPAPSPWFPSCVTIQWLRDHGATEEVVGDMVRMVNVMKKLETLQPEAEREKLGNCPHTVPNAGGGLRG